MLIIKTAVMCGRGLGKIWGLKPEEAGFLELPRGNALQRRSQRKSSPSRISDMSRLRFAAWMIFCTWTKAEARHNSSYQYGYRAQISASLSDRLESSPNRSPRFT